MKSAIIYDGYSGRLPILGAALIALTATCLTASGQSVLGQNPFQEVQVSTISAPTIVTPSEAPTSLDLLQMHTSLTSSGSSTFSANIEVSFDGAWGVLSAGWPSRELSPPARDAGFAQSSQFGGRNAGESPIRGLDYANIHAGQPLHGLPAGNPQGGGFLGSSFFGGDQLHGGSSGHDNDPSAFGDHSRDEWHHGHHRNPCGDGDQPSVPEPSTWFAGFALTSFALLSLKRRGNKID